MENDKFSQLLVSVPYAMFDGQREMKLPHPCVLFKATKAVLIASSELNDAVQGFIWAHRVTLWFLNNTISEIPKGEYSCQ